MTQRGMEMPAGMPNQGISQGMPQMGQGFPDRMPAGISLQLMQQQQQQIIAEQQQTAAAFTALVTIPTTTEPTTADSVALQKPPTAQVSSCIPLKAL